MISDKELYILITAEGGFSGDIDADLREQLQAVIGNGWMRTFSKPSR